MSVQVVLCRMLTGWERGALNDDKYYFNLQSPYLVIDTTKCGLSMCLKTY